jgi:hypothetical protein
MGVDGADGAIGQAVTQIGVEIPNRSGDSAGGGGGVLAYHQLILLGAYTFSTDFMIKARLGQIVVKLVCAPGAVAMPAYFTLVLVFPYRSISQIISLWRLHFKLFYQPGKDL